MERFGPATILLVILGALSACEGTRPGSANHLQERAGGPPAAQIDPTFPDMEAVENWITYYYESPRPDQVPGAFRAFARLMKQYPKSNAAGPMSGFFGAVAKTHPELVASWTRELGDLEPADLKVWWAGLWLSGTPEAKAQIAERAERATGAEANLLRKYGTRTTPVLLELDPDPGVLDLWWATFFATGDEQYIRQIIPLIVAESRVSSTQADLSVTKASANWSLRANAFQHGRVLEICRSEVGKHPETVDAELRAIISQVEERLGKEPSPDPAKRSKPGSESGPPS
jgi:hypothetical protein